MSDRMTRLVELKAMLDEGLIDRAEFEVLKADILGAASPPASVPSATQRPLQPEISKPPAADSKPPAPSAYRPTEQVFSVRYRIKTSLLGVALSSRGAEASFTMVSLPAGSFSMGSPDDEPEAGDREKPQHTVSLSHAFQLGRVPVTHQLWQAVVGSNPSDFKGSDQLPVEQVSWFDCIRFCNALSQKCGLKPAYNIRGNEDPNPRWDRTAAGFRLPTEAEWEYAGRAGQGSRYRYTGSDSIDEVAWYKGNSGARPHPVGQKSPNAWGLHDMSGNVWEWCWDWYAEDAYQAEPRVDPVGPQLSSERAYRGGSWRYGPRFARLASRGKNPPTDRRIILGLRLARTIS